MRGTIELLLGGARCGKSDWAVSCAQELGGEVLFIATAEPRDEDMKRRIEAHRRARPAQWRTLEEPLAVADRIRALERTYDVAVLDCVTLLVNNWLLAGELATVADSSVGDVRARIVNLCDALRSRVGHTIVVSNEVGSGIVPISALARSFRDELGAANRAAAAEADQVRLLVAGLPLSLKERN